MRDVSKMRASILLCLCIQWRLGICQIDYCDFIDLGGALQAISSDGPINLFLDAPQSVCIGCLFFAGISQSLQNETVYEIRKGGGSATPLDGVDGVTVNDNGTLFVEDASAVFDVGDTLECTFMSTTRLATIAELIFGPPTLNPSGIVDIAEGENLTLSCEDPGNTNNERYQWFNDSNEMSITDPDISPPLVYTITNIQREASGNYSCVLTDGNIPNITPITTVTVNVQYPALISSIAPINIISPRNSSVSIVCVYDGNPDPMVSWVRGMELLDDTSDDVTITTTSTESTLTLSNIQPSDGGNYRCITNNTIGPGNVDGSIGGYASDNATLVVQDELSSTALPVTSVSSVTTPSAVTTSGSVASPPAITSTVIGTVSIGTVSESPNDTPTTSAMVTDGVNITAIIVTMLALVSLLSVIVIILLAWIVYRKKRLSVVKALSSNGSSHRSGSIGRKNSHMYDTVVIGPAHGDTYTDEGPLGIATSTDQLLDSSATSADSNTTNSEPKRGRLDRSMVYAELDDLAYSFNSQHKSSVAKNVTTPLLHDTESSVPPPHTTDINTITDTGATRDADTEPGAEPKTLIYADLDLLHSAKDVIGKRTAYTETKPHKVQVQNSPAKPQGIIYADLELVRKNMGIAGQQTKYVEIQPHVVQKEPMSQGLGSATGHDTAQLLKESSPPASPKNDDDRDERKDLSPLLTSNAVTSASVTQL